MIIEPDQGRILLTWRTNVSLGRKLNALREIWVGKQPHPEPPRRGGKPHFKSINDLVAWKKQNGGRIEMVSEN